MTSAAPAGAGEELSPLRRRGEAIALAVGFVALAAVVIGTRWGVFTPDTRPDLYEQPGRFLRSTFEAWVGGAMGLGQGNFNAGAAPVAAVVWVIRTLGAPAWLAVRIWRLLLLVIAAWGIRRYLRTLFRGELPPVTMFAVTAFWVANPYVIVAGNTTPILLPYALLPWMMLAFLHAARRGGWRWPAVFALAFFAQAGLNAGVVSFLGLLALPGHLFYVRVVDGRPWRELLGAVLRCGALSVVVSLYWLAPSFLATGTGAAIASSTERPADVARTSSYSEVGRGLGQWALYGRAGDRHFLGGYTAYLTNPLVVISTFAVMIGVAFALWRSRRPARILAIGLLLVGLPVSVGMFPGTDPYPVGRFMASVFDAVPATMAFRTTNKVGAVVVLGMAVAVALGVEALRRRTADRPRVVRTGVACAVVVVLVGISTPMWNGSLYPLGHTLPDTWRDATTDLDAAGDGRVLVVPGGTGGNYRWGMRSPDDLFPSNLDRPVVSRNTVVGAGDPAGNLLTWFDTSLQQGVLATDGVSAMARFLGADTVVDRNDVLSEETNGAAPAVIADVVRTDPGLLSVATYGEPGVDTVPGSSGPADAAAVASDPGSAALPPIEVHEVSDPLPPVVLSDPTGLVVVDGDGLAFSTLGDAGLVDGTRPVRYLGDMGAEELLGALRGGARLALTDTNQRRGWDINRLLDASSPVLRAEDPFEIGNGPSVTLWPDDPELQTVAEIGAVGSGGPVVERVDTDVEVFGVRPWEKPIHAVDGNPATSWWTGGILDPTGGSITIRLAEPTTISNLAIQVARSEPAVITEVLVEVGDQAHVIETRPEEAVGVLVSEVIADEITITITGASDGLNPVGITEVTIDDAPIGAVDVLRMPRTLTRLAEEGGSDLLAALEDAPIDIVATRLRGRAGNASDDEEPILARRFELPVGRTFDFTARLRPFEMDPAVLDAFRGGDAACMPVATIDGTPVLARLTGIDGDHAAGSVTIEGCAPVVLDAGPHELGPFFGWRLEQVQLASGDADASEGGSAPHPVEIVESSATRMVIVIPPDEDGRLLRLGIAYDERWTMSLDGVDAGAPILLDGYSLAWEVGPEGGRAIVEFPPQGAVRLTVLVSAVGLVGVTAMAVAPSQIGVSRREEAAADDPEGGPDEGEGDR